MVSVPSATIAQADLSHSGVGETARPITPCVKTDDGRMSVGSGLSQSPMSVVRLYSRRYKRDPGNPPVLRDLAYIFGRSRQGEICPSALVTDAFRLQLPE